MRVAEPVRACRSAVAVSNHPAHVIATASTEEKRAVCIDEGADHAIDYEAGFRDKEAAILAELCKLERHVIATGGGIVLRPENRERLSEAGRVIWLNNSRALGLSMRSMSSTARLCRLSASRSWA